ncbi:MAG: CoA pyrophosphatase [Epulopiscium sp.]|nr:CoA pyrophosphatase [Candidatus Epulonipiscium sp.]
MDKHQLAILKQKLAKEPIALLGHEEFFKAGVCVLLLWIDEEYHFVFQKRTPHIPQGGEICFPGGKFDPLYDQNFLDTALRETEEEMGISRSKLHVIGPLGTLITPAGMLIEAFIAVAQISSIEEIQINEEEVEQIFTIPVSYFQKEVPLRYTLNIEMQPFEIDAKGQEKILFPAREFPDIPVTYSKPWTRRNKYPIYVYPLDCFTLWGITADLVYEFIKRIEKED